MVSEKKLILFIIVSVALLSLSKFLIIQLKAFKSKALLVRIHTVAILEILMSVLSYLAWRTLRPLPPLIVSSTPLPTVVASFSKTKLSLRRQKTSETDLTVQNHNHLKVEDQRRWTFWDAAVALYIILCHGSYATNLFLIGTEPHWLSLLCYTCLGSLLHLGFAIFLIHVFTFLSSIFAAWFCGKSDRNNFNSSVKSQRNSALLAISYAVIVSVTGLYKAAQPPSVKYVEIPIKNLPNNLKGLRIVQLSDIHLGPTVGYSKLKAIVNAADKEKPDILVITGDLVDGTVGGLKDAAIPLKFINPRYGKYYVTGNHEYYLGNVDTWFALVKSLNFTVLHNSNVKIPRTKSAGQGQICLAGTDDIEADETKYGLGHTFDVKRAVEGCADEEPVILLAHQPSAAQAALDSGVRLDLILSGHTHGGQMFPFDLLVYLSEPFSAGLYKDKGHGTHIYVSSGCEFWGIPMRVGTTKEITSLKLV